jgi:competence protein ComFC
VKCITCSACSFHIICKNCQKHLLEPELRKKEILKDFFVYYFYEYDEIKELIYTKYDSFGAKVFSTLANISFARFAKTFTYQNRVYAIPIENNKIDDFSHTAILSNGLKSKYITPYPKLRANNIVKYANMDLEFRLKNRRDFKYLGKKNIEAIIIDDIITTGTTIKEAKSTLTQNGVKTLFAITLTYAGD